MKKNNIVYTVGELKRIIKESSNEFKPVIGPNVERDSKRDSDKFYKDTENAVKKFDGGLKKLTKGKLPKKDDGNKTTLDYRLTNEPDDNFKKKVNSQAKGYTSELEEKNGIKKASATFDDDNRILKQFNDAREEMDKNREELQRSGWQASKMSADKFKSKHVNESAPKPIRLNFKKTTFLNESQMLARIPEEYKIDGQVIHMKDGSDNEYVVECHFSAKSGIMETNIVKYENKTIINEQLQRMQQLMDYKPSYGNIRDNKTMRMNESKEFKEIMDLSRKSTK